MNHQEVLTYVLQGKAEFSDIKKEVNDLGKLLNKLELPDNVKSSFKSLFASLDSSIDKFLDKSKNIVDKKSLNDLKRLGSEIRNTSKEISDSFTKNVTSDVWAKVYTSEPVNKLRQDLAELQNQLANFDSTKIQGITILRNALQSLQESYSGKRTPNAVKALSDALQSNEFNRLGTIIGQLKQLKAVSNDKELTAQLDEGLKNIRMTTEELEKQIVNTQSEISNLIQSDEAFRDATNAVNNSIHTEVASLNQLVDSTYAVGEANYFASQNVERFASKFRQLLSYGSGLALLRKAIQNAYATVKELDAAMTETATVTDYSVGQMWDKLDEYTSIANRLGATTLGTYKTITLFFQQGLDEAQALSLATETMKMARVANIDYADATEYMTSALRGFNMELNETSATRVNDVYSELAKITAADTNQIAIAMSKVASLANSANMELETTSAFLSQIIETTQEAPETAGTALKTIIARFSEVKKLFSEGEITGTDEEGETVDVNKIGGALRTVGIDLNKYISGAVGLDEIFLELAEKWDSLTLVQQRYIATQAAGSRQQSRFIAMMQNYGRTMELVNAAYSSAGSGQEQFEKTLESLYAKLNKLQNAWDSFSMSIAQSGLIKGAVDTLTQLLTIINNLSDSIPVLGDKIGGVFRLLMGYGLFKGGQALFDAPLTALIDTFDNTKSVQQAMIAANVKLGESFKNVSKQITTFINPKANIAFQREQAQAIYDPKILETTQLLSEAQNKLFETESALSYATSMGIEPTKAQTEAFQTACKSVQEYREQLDALTTAQNNSFTKVDGWLTGLSSKATDAGIVFVSLGAILTQIGAKTENEAMQKLGSLSTTIGGITIAVGQLAGALPKLANALHLTTGALGAIGLALSLVAGLFIWAKDRQEKYQEHLVELYDQSNKIGDKLSEVSSNLETLGQTKDSLDDLTVGSAKWYEQLAKIKDIIDDLIEKDPEIGNFLKYDPTQGYVLDEDEYDKYVKNNNKKRDSAAGVSIVHNRTTGTLATQTDFGNLDNQYAYEINNNMRGSRAYDVDALSNFYNISIDSVEEAITKAREEREKTDENWARQFIENITGETDFENSDEVFNYLEELFISRLLEDAAKHAREEEENSELRDRIGQNIYANNREVPSEELGEKLDAKLVSSEDADALAKYWETLEDLPKILKENSNLMKELALDTGSAIQDFDKFAKTIKDNRDELEDLDHASTGFQKALGSVAKASEEAFGQALDASFIEDNLSNFIAAFVDGSQAALDEIRDALWLDLQVDLDQGNIDDIQLVLNQLAQDRSFLLTGTADLTPLFQTILQGEELTVENLTRIQNAIQALGFQLAINYDKDEKGNITRITGAVLSDAARTSVYNRTPSASKGSSGGGGSSKQEKPWENPYDQLYNLTERNEEAIRRRNILEKQYNAILRDREGTSTQLLRNSLQELANLQEQLSYQRQLQRGRQAQLDAVNSEMYMDSEGTRKSYSAWGVTKYAKYNQQTNAIEIDWDAIDRVTDEQTGKAIEDYVKRLEELQKQFEQVDSDILDIEEEIDEINQRGKGEYLDFEQKVYDAIVQTYQDVIDSFSSLNDTINDSNEKILDDLQEQIDLERQIRDNTKEEEEIGDKETRLAYLQRDTSGANATEILRLQEEIADARQNYTDKLIDQKLTQLSKDNDDAAEQRQMQITLMQEQLDYWTQIGAFWRRVDTLLSEAINKDGSLKNNSDLVTLLMNDENFGGLSKFGKQGWEDDLVKSFMESMEGYGKWMIEEAEKKGEITQDGNTYKYNKDRKAWMLGNEAYSAIYNPATQRYEFTRVKDKDVQVGTIGSGNQTSGGGGYNPGGTSSGTTTTTTTTTTTSTPSKHRYYVTAKNGWSTTVTATSESQAKEIAQKLMMKEYGFTSSSNFPYSASSFSASKGAPVAYKKGGLADFTGPAWLDGSKSQPEAVLSAKQTEMFISLRDLLERISQSGGLTSNSFGNTYIDLDVNADIGSDYDVDSLVNRLKRDILESSNYRNVNALTRGH